MCLKGEKEMNIEEVKEMGNHELIIRFQGLCHVQGSRDITCKEVDEDLYLDIHILEEEILLRMSRGDTNG